MNLAHHVPPAKGKESAKATVSRLLRGFCCAGFAFALSGAGPASAQENSRANPYAGKQITIIVSSAPGGGYDAITRTVSRHLGRHIPGSPAIIVQNMNGAGGIVAANHLYNIASRDGSVIAQLQNTVPFEPMYGNKQARYEPTQLNWLGSPSKETALVIAWSGSRIRTLADATRHEFILGATGASSTPAFYARLLADVFGLKIKLVSGYPGQAEQFLAMERGENEGGPSTFLSSLKTMRPSWIPEKKIRLLLQYALEPSPELKEVPFALDLLKDRADDLKLMEIASAPLTLGRPFAAPPGVPADRLAQLRQGFAATFADSEFQGDCEKQGLECDTSSSGEQIQKIVADAYAAPADVIARLQRIHASRL